MCNTHSVCGFLRAGAPDMHVEQQPACGAAAAQGAAAAHTSLPALQPHYPPRRPPRRVRGPLQQYGATGRTRFCVRAREQHVMGGPGEPAAAQRKLAPWTVCSISVKDEHSADNAAAAGVADTYRLVSTDGVGYTVHTNKRSWAAAQQRCQQDGMHLVRLYSRQHGAQVHQAVSAVSNDSFWIGLTDAAQEGLWAWMMVLCWAQKATGRRTSPTTIGMAKIAVSCACRAYTGYPEWNDVQCDDQFIAVCGPASIANACARMPCLPPATCTPLLAGGRTCSCPESSVYKDDVFGCGTSIPLSIGDGVHAVSVVCGCTVAMGAGGGCLQAARWQPREDQHAARTRLCSFMQLHPRRCRGNPPVAFGSA